MEEVFFRNHPCCTSRPEVTPTVIGMETRRCIAAVRTRQEIFFVEIVLNTAKVTFGIIIGRIRSCTFIGYGTNQLGVGRVEHIRFRTHQIVIFMTVRFMSQHHGDIVMAEHPLPVQNLLVVVRHVTQVIFIRNTVFGSILAIIRVGNNCLTGFVHIDTPIESKLEISQETHFKESVGTHGITFTLISIQQQIGSSIRITQYRTYGTCILAVTIVITHDAVSIGHDISVTVTHIHRINRGNLCSNGKNISG